MAEPFFGAPVSGDAVRTAVNLFGVDPTVVTDLLDPNSFTSQVPRTRTRTSHGLLIRVASGRVVGAINEFSHSTTRDVRDVFEINANSYGQAPVDLIPGNVTSRTISVQRYDLFQAPMEEAFGTGFEYETLADQARPFSLRTIWRSPVGSALGGRRVYEYTGCYFTRIGRTARTTDSRIVNVNAEITYVLRRRIT